MAKLKLLIAYDGTKGSSATLTGLKSAGLPADAEALVLTLADVMPLPPESPKKAGKPAFLSKPGHDARLAIQQAIETARKISEQGAKDLKKLFPKWNISASAFADSPAWGIIKKAEEWKADLVVLGSHGINPAALVFAGSVAIKVASECHSSVRVMRAGVANSPGALKILAGLDGSKNSDIVIKEIASRQWPKGTSIHLVTAIDAGLASAITIYGSPLRQWIQNNDRSHIQWAHRMAQSSVEKLRKAGLEVSYLVKEGDPKNILLEEAKKWKADSLFVGSRGLNGLKKILLGSVSTAVAVRAHCSVEIVRNFSKK